MWTHAVHLSTLRYKLDWEASLSDARGQIGCQAIQSTSNVHGCMSEGRWKMSKYVGVWFAPPLGKLFRAGVSSRHPQGFSRRDVFMQRNSNGADASSCISFAPMCVRKRGSPPDAPDTLETRLFGNGTFELWDVSLRPSM